MITGPCGRHGCGHDAGDHADMRTPSGKRRLYRGECKRCRCPRWVEEPPCKGIAPTVTVAASGVRYERCACGAVTQIKPEEVRL